MLRLTRRLPGAAAAARCGSGGAIRRFGVMAVPTPNPAARQYWPCSGETVLDSPGLHLRPTPRTLLASPAPFFLTAAAAAAGPALEYRRRAAAQESALASRLLTLDRAVSAVTLAESFVTVSIDLGRTSWDDELPGGGEAITVGDAVEQCIGQFLDASLPIVSAAVRDRRHAAAAQSTADEHPTVSQIKVCALLQICSRGVAPLGRFVWSVSRCAAGSVGDTRESQHPG
jgi:hypothetical protein